MPLFDPFRYYMYLFACKHVTEVHTVWTFARKPGYSSGCHYMIVI